VLALDRAIAAGRAVRSFDRDGRLRVVANISKAVVSPYLGEEIPGWQSLGLDPRREYRLLRHPDELRKAARTFDGLPVLSMHRPIGADAHPRELVVGTVGTDVKFAGPYLVGSVVVWDQHSISAIENGEKRELSCGYHYRPVMTPGVFEGRRYDGVMRDIVGNHVALVGSGRVGSDCRL
jgi:hypothetical protein